MLVLDLQRIIEIKKDWNISDARQKALVRITSYNVCYTKLLREKYQRLESVLIVHMFDVEIL